MEQGFHNANQKENIHQGTSGSYSNFFFFFFFLYFNLKSNKTDFEIIPPLPP